MQNNLKYTNLSWAVVGICEGSHMPLSALVHEGDDMEKTVEHYVIGYLAFWHIAFVDESRLVACGPSRRCPVSTSSFSVSRLPRWKPTA